ncbi:photosystem II cytochrome PsbV2 [Oscillatoria sp. FACHB-1407]|uniref:photosystem II cytochrome PsbV2 n=1 Tax=Oscillatoria sp. FACHB-1407 TaxID=2692847 RepID=UPI00168584E5|nr:photosystem II cytochrome PsbV2 [Oscillatoria sp. FACHB-1407]MBD2461208.1 photosystem II cytochrome PsbV2 [Oscillatoria sp. FACHB-1407]
MRFPIAFRCFLQICFVVCLSVLALASPAQAVSLDSYVLRYLDASEPVELSLDESKTGLFSAADLSEGKRLFEANCKNCHAGGATLPDPTVPLSLEALRHATPPRDAIAPLVAFMRQPMTYDGTEESFSCRDIPESWMSQAQVEHLAAFILRAAQKAPGWGGMEF